MGYFFLAAFFAFFATDKAIATACLGFILGLRFNSVRIFALIVF